MPNKTPIEWTDYTSNPIYAVNKETEKRGWFCEKISPGCGHCYSEGINVGRLGNKLAFQKQNAEKVEFVLNEKELFEIIKLNNRLAKKGETKTLFLMDMSDLFLEHHSDTFIDKIFATIALCPNIIFQILTKRVDRMRDYTHDNYAGRMYELAAAADWVCAKIGKTFGYNFMASFANELPQVWLGCSVENQKQKSRIDELREVSAAIRFLSLEPLLEDLGELNLQGIDWVIVGGESGHNARLCYTDWIRSIVRQCQSAEVPVFVKQLGANAWRYKIHPPTDISNKHGSWKLDLKNKKGGLIEEFPEDLRIRQMPKL